MKILYTILFLTLLTGCFKKREEPAFTAVSGTYRILYREYYSASTGRSIGIRNVPAAYSSVFKDSLDNISFINIKADGVYQWFEYNRGVKVWDTKGTIKNINDRESLSAKSIENNYPYLVRISNGGLQIRMDFKGSNSESLFFRSFLEMQ